MFEKPPGRTFGDPLLKQNQNPFQSEEHYGVSATIDAIIG